MEKYKCSICPAEFKTQRGLDNHKHRWICPTCGAKLKTATGYERHVKRHETKSDERKRLEQLSSQYEDNVNKLIKKMKDSGLFVPKYKPEDKVILSTYRVTKPTHEQRGNRIVHVRYEEERYYYADTFTVTGVNEPKPHGVNTLYLVEKTIKNKEPYPITYTTDRGVKFFESEVFQTIEDAEADVKQKQEAYKKSCEQAAMYR